jgi:hypothetical protein
MLKASSDRQHRQGDLWTCPLYRTVGIGKALQKCLNLLSSVRDVASLDALPWDGSELTNSADTCTACYLR